MPPILKYFNPIQKSFSSSFALIEDDLAELSISSQVLTPKTQAIPLSVKPDPLVFDRNCNKEMMILMLIEKMFHHT